MSRLSRLRKKLALLLRGAQQVVVVGNGRGYLCALITGDVTAAAAQGAIDAVNADLPHYRQIRKFTILASPFTAQDGLLNSDGEATPRRN